MRRAREERQARGTRDWWDTSIISINVHQKRLMLCASYGLWPQHSNITTQLDFFLVMIQCYHNQHQPLSIFSLILLGHLGEMQQTVNTTLTNRNQDYTFLYNILDTDYNCKLKHINWVYLILSLYYIGIAWRNNWCTYTHLASFFKITLVFTASRLQKLEKLGFNLPSSVSRLVKCHIAPAPPFSLWK